MKHLFNPKETDIRLMYGLAGLVFFVAAGFVLWMIVYGTNPFGTGSLIDPNPTTDAQQDEQCEKRNRVNGACEDDVTTTTDKYVAVMIENHPDARPQSGLADAIVVYEAPVEANFSRFMAIYPSTADVSKIGPVRSARPYYLDWLAEYGDALYVHVGGAPIALERITAEGVNDFNEFFKGQFFWRSADRFAPHNTYTSTKLLRDGLAQQASQYSNTAVTPWKFAQQEPCTDNCATEIIATFNGTTYQATWRYNSSTQEYIRYQDGRPHADMGGATITADTIIVQSVESTVIDAVGRLDIDTIGTGEVTVFAQGHVTTGTWQKETLTGRTRWLDADGTDIALQPGTIWIEVLNERASLEYTTP